MTYFGDLCGKVRDVHFLWVITLGGKKKLIVKRTEILSLRKIRPLEKKIKRIMH